VGFVRALCAGSRRRLNYRSNRQRSRQSAPRHPGRAVSKKGTSGGMDCWNYSFGHNDSRLEVYPMLVQTHATME